MTPTATPRVLAILGPTASGKTRVALEVARRVGGEIISADSRQAYRGLAVGTAAPTVDERAEIPHHGVAFLEPGERYGAGRFARLARGWIEEAEKRGAVPVVTGGTGFFVRALTDPVFRQPELDPERRARLERWLSARPLSDLRRWTRRLDPDLARRLAVLDPQRSLRALELALLTGRPLTWWQRHGSREAAPIEVDLWVLELDAPALRARIEARTRRLLEQGWLEEVAELTRAGHGPESPALSSIGYRSVWRLNRGEISRETAVRDILRDTWRYARRQRTWLRHQLPAHARRVDAERAPEEVAAEIVAGWRAVASRAPRRTDGPP